MEIGIASPYLGPEEQRAVLEVLASGQLIQGAQVAEFERRFAAAHGAVHGVATSNGTAALTAALLALGIGPGDEVIVPAFSFFATASSVVATGAVPRFADIEPATYALSVEAAEAAITPRTRAIMPVHLYGHPADMPRFAALCSRRGLLLLEDAAQAHLAAIDGRHVGTWGTAAFSFHPTKNMTTTEGGMVLTDDDALAARLRMLRDQGRSAPYHHELMGLNLRMTNLCGAIGLCQLARLAGWTEQREQNAAAYRVGLERVTHPSVRRGCRHVFHQYTIRVPSGADRDAIAARLRARGIGVRVYYPLAIHQQPAMRRRYAELSLPEASLPETERACREVLSLPVHPRLTPTEIDTVIREVNAAC